MTVKPQSTTLLKWFLSEKVPLILQNNGQANKITGSEKWHVKDVIPKTEILHVLLNFLSCVSYITNHSTDLTIPTHLIHQSIPANKTVDFTIHGLEVSCSSQTLSKDWRLTVMPPETESVKTIMVWMPDLLNFTTDTILLTWTVTNKVLLRLGVTGTGLLPSVENGVSGVTSTTTGLEELGSGSTTSPTVTAEKSEQIFIDLHILLDSSLDSNLYFYHDFSFLNLLKNLQNTVKHQFKQLKVPFCSFYSNLRKNQLFW